MNLSAIVRATVAIVIGGLIVTLGVAPGAEAVTTGAVTGTVWLGTSHSAAPAGSVVVTAAPVGQDPALASGGVPVDSAGHFTITGLAVGNVVLFYHYVGSGRYRSLYTQGSRTLSNAGFVLVVGPAITNDASIVLPLHAIVSGHVSLGTVGAAAPAGHPISLSWWGQSSGAVTIGSDGNYSLDLDAGSYQLSFYDPTLDFQSRMVDTLTVAGVDQPGSDVLLPRSGTITGHVALGTSTNSAPAGSVQVGWVSGCTWGCTYDFSNPATVDASGNFSIPHLLNGTYQLSYRYTAGTAYQTTTPTTTYQITDTATTVAATAIMLTAGSITGTVTLGTSTHTAPAGSVTAYLDGKDNALQTSTVDAAGHYSFTGLTANNYTVQFVYSGAGHFADVWWPTRQSWNIASQIAVTSAPVIADTTLPVSGSISGVTTDSHGAPVAGLQVDAYQSGQRSDDPMSREVGVTTTHTSADGSYAFPRLAAGTYSINIYDSTTTATSVQHVGVSFGSLTVTDGSVAPTTNAVMYVKADLYVTMACPLCSSALDLTANPVDVHIDKLTSSPGQPVAWTEIPLATAFRVQQVFTTAGLAPGHYRLRTVISAFSAYQSSPPVEVDVAEATRTPITVTVQPVDLINNPRPGSLIKSAGSAAVYLVDGTSRLVPLSSFAVAIDAGLGTAYTVVPQAVINARSIDPLPLTNMLNCGGSYYVVGTTGRVSVDPAYATGPRATSLDPTTCSAMTSTGRVMHGGLFITTPNGQDYSIGLDGVKHPLSDSRAAFAMVYPDSITIASVGQYFADTLSTGSLIVSPTTLIKSANSTAVYMADGLDRKVPISSFAIVADMGLPTTYLTVSQAYLDSLTTAPAPLTEVVSCYGGMIGGSGHLWSITSSLLAGLPMTSLEMTTCATWGHYGPTFITNALFLASSSTGALYDVDAGGHRRPIYSMATPPQLSAPDAPVYLRVTDAFLNSIPLGTAFLPAGTLVKASTSDAVYLADGTTGLVPISSFATAASAGISTAFRTVPASDLTGLTIAPAPLTNSITCGGGTWFAGSGALWPVAPSLVAGLPSTVLSDATCSTLPHAGISLNHALFVKSASSAAIWNVSAVGQRRAVFTMDSLTALSAPDPAVYLTVSDAFIASLPVGPELLMPGMLVKTAASDAIYVYDGSAGLIPVATFTSISDIGLSTGYRVVAASTLASMTVATAPLSNIVTCGGERWIASGGHLTRLGSAGSGIAATALSAALCAVIAKSSAPAPAQTFVKSPNDPSIYLLGSADKEPVGGWAVMLRLTNNQPTWLTVDDRFLIGVPTGPVVR